MALFAFPEDARWSHEQGAVEFSVILGEYQGIARIARRVFQRLLNQSDARALPRSLSSSADPVRDGGRTKAAATTVDR